MTIYDEQNSEAIILEKLERMEAFAKALVASLEASYQVKGRTHEVRPPRGGTIIWLKSDGDFVGWHQEIALVKYGRTLEESEPVHARIDGTLRILVPSGGVTERTVIAEIVPSALV